MDLLGFVSLTEEFDIDLDALRRFDTPLAWTIGDFLSASENHLTTTFGNFHASLRASVALAQMKHRLTAITFSDSAFIATDSFYRTARIAVELVQSLLAQRIPVRIGIGFGSFVAVRFRSDVMNDGGDHAAHFLGTGVVRSHVAETCGIKGIRILLHPSVLPLLDQEADRSDDNKNQTIPIVELPAEERGKAVGVLYEIDYWRLRPTAERRAWHALQDMWASAPAHAEEHYVATAEAINRMRIGQGAPPLSNLRRRTLPRFERLTS